MNEPSHKLITTRIMNWEKVEEKIKLFPNIGETFSIENMKTYQDKPPYYCHYLAWRLATWNDDSLFAYFEQRLELGRQLKGWNQNRIPNDGEYSNYWSFLWELQVASFFSEKTSKDYLSWLNNGPDLFWDDGKDNCYIECTVYRKSFGLENYINDLLRSIHPFLSAHHSLFIRLSLTTKNIENLLDKIFSPFLVEGYLEDKIRKSEQISPLLLEIPELPENFYVCVDNPDSKEKSLFLPWAMASNPEKYLEVARREVLMSKQDSNKLQQKHPNLVMANLVLSGDYQIASVMRNETQLQNLNPFDGIVYSACGIDRHDLLTRSQRIITEDHPLKRILL